jgi:hypothetical protein
MSLQCLGVGLSRTGTKSLWKAMSQLGFKSLHFEPDRLADVILGMNRNPTFKGLYDDCDFICDIPHAYFFRDIEKAYPGLKFILTIRDTDAWYRSMCEHYRKLPDRFREWSCGNPHKFASDWKQVEELQRIVYGSGTFWDLPEFLYKKRFRDWNESVRRFIPDKERLLVMDIPGGDGYEKLCHFLDNRRVPDESFPHENKQ